MAAEPRQYWLVKSEPDAFSWDQQVANGVEPWTGVRNHTAKNNLKAMRLGDRAFFYHSNIGKEIVGVVEVAREAYPDPTAEKRRLGVRGHARGRADAAAGHARRHEGRPGAGGAGADPPVAAVGAAGVGGALGAYMPAGRLEGVSVDLYETDFIGWTEQQAACCARRRRSGPTWPSTGTIWPRRSRIWASPTGERWRAMSPPSSSTC